MIFGIGYDLCEIARMERSLTGPHGGAFARRVFGQAERAALGLSESGAAADAPARRWASAAADFAAKEAFLKAAGTGMAGPFALCEIEAVRLQSGAPVYVFHGGTAEWVAARGLRAHLSLTHEAGLAGACCVLETAGDGACGR